MASATRIGDIMVAKGLLSSDDAEALAKERVRSAHRLASLAVAKGLVAEQAALAALSEQQGVPAIDLTRIVISQHVVARIPLEVAWREVMLPIRIDGSNLLVATASPGDWRAIDEVGFATGQAILPHVALHSRLLEIIPRAHAQKGPYFVGENVEAWSVGADVNARALPLVQGALAAEPIEIDVDVLLEDVEPLEDSAAGQNQPSDPNLPVVLVVEDDPDIQKLIVTALKPLNVTVLSCRRGLEALQLIKQQNPSLLVLDAMLPEVHGFEICRKVKESKRFGHTPVLMISAIYRGWRIAEDIKNTYKVDGFLEKPFRVGDLRRVVVQLLERTPAKDDDDLSSGATEHIGRATQAFAAQDFETAFDALRTAEALEPFSCKIQYMLGQVLERRERAFQAIYHYERAVELNPQMFAATKTLAMLYQKKGFRNKAVEMWERSMAAAPTVEIRAQIKQYLVSML